MPSNPYAVPSAFTPPIPSTAATPASVRFANPITDASSHPAGGTRLMGSEESSALATPDQAHDTEQGATDEDDPEGLAGIDWPTEGGRLSKALFCLELPLSVMRWASIPSDASWDSRRCKWMAANPPCVAALLTLKVCGGVVGAWECRAAWMPWLLLAPLLASPFSYVVQRLITTEARPRFFTSMVVLGFLTTIIWLDLLAAELVALIEAGGLLIGVSTSILGLTVIAIGNSSGDLVANIAAARGEPSSVKMGVAACFGAPLLMNLIGAGASLSVRMIVTAGQPVSSSISQICRIAFLFVFIALGSHLVYLPRHNYTASKGYALYLWSLYALFIIMALLAEGGLMGSFMM